MKYSLNLHDLETFMLFLNLGPGKLADNIAHCSEADSLFCSECFLPWFHWYSVTSYYMQMHKNSFFICYTLGSADLRIKEKSEKEEIRFSIRLVFLPNMWLSWSR